MSVHLSALSLTHWKIVSLPPQIVGDSGTQEPRSHTALRWDSVPIEGHPETQEPRNHAALRRGLFDRDVPASRGGYPQLR